MTFNIGDIVWAKKRGFPHWPSIISYESGSLFRRTTPKTTQFHVTYLIDNGQDWIAVENIRNFDPDDTAPGPFYSIES